MSPSLSLSPTHTHTYFLQTVYSHAFSCSHTLSHSTFPCEKPQLLNDLQICPVNWYWHSVSYTHTRAHTHHHRHTSTQVPQWLDLHSTHKEKENTDITPILSCFTSVCVVIGSINEDISCVCRETKHQKMTRIQRLWREITFQSWSPPSSSKTQIVFKYYKVIT